MFQIFRQDVRHAIRTLLRAPVFTFAAVASLALGIGANTAIFSAIDEILLRPIAVPHPDQLAQVYSLNRKTFSYVSSSYPDYADFRDRAQSFQQLSAYVRLPLNAALEGGVTERVTVEAVTGNYFDMLRLAPLAGRALSSEDDRAGTPAAMIAEALWRSRFRADLGMVGKSVRIEGQAFTLVGVVPDRLEGMNLNWATPPQIWVPLRFMPLLLPRMPAATFQSRAARLLVLTGRLKPGVSATTAQAEIQTIAGQLAQSDPAADRDFTAMVFPLSRSKFWPSYRTAIANSLAVFAFACGLVLLIACANVSNLLLARAVSRRREFAVRLAIGASRWRLVRQLLTESLALAIPAGAAALLVGQALMKLLLRFPNALGLSLSLNLTLEGRAMAFCLGTSVVTTILFGLAPALQATRPEILPALKQSGAALPGSGRGWLRGSLVTVQVAFCTLLLIGAGLYGRSLHKVYSVDPGFRADRLFTATFNLGAPGAQAAARIRNSQGSLLRELASTAGIIAATTSSRPLLSSVKSPVAVDTGDGAESAISVESESTGPDYLATVGTPLASGRDFNAGDDANSAKVAMLNQALAARLWPGANPVGRTLYVHQRAGAVAATVVGVARNAHNASLWEDPQPRLFLPAGQAASPGDQFFVRSNLPPAETAAALRKIWGSLEPSVPVYDFQTAAERVNQFLMPQRVAVGIFAAFGFLAIVLASVGLYSLVAYSVIQRRREIGIRIAVGAAPQSVVGGIVRASMRLVLLGLALGIGAGLLLARYLASQIKEVSPYDLPTFAAVALLLAAVAFAAAIVPARRAATIDPLAALRAE